MSKTMLFIDIIDFEPTVDNPERLEFEIFHSTEKQLFFNPGIYVQYRKNNHTHTARVLNSHIEEVLDACKEHLKYPD